MQDSHSLIWDAAIPLSRAALHYAPKDLKVQWAELSKGNPVVEGLKAYREARKANWLDAMNDFVSASHAVSEPQDRIIKETKSLLLAHIKAGRVLGLGYEPPRRIASIPVYVPAEYWQGWVDWEASVVSHGTLKFVDVRVITPQAAQPILLKFKANELQMIEGSPRPVGRPSIKAHVETAFAALTNAGAIDASKSAKSHFLIVRQWIIKNSSYDAEALSDEGIRAHFSPLFSELKKDRKQ